MYFPDDEKVSVAWLKTLPGVPSTVGTTLPGNPLAWSTDGFVQVTVVGGTPELDSPLYRPVLQVDVWTNTPNSGKPPWGKAGALAANIIFQTYNVANIEKSIAMPDTFYDVRVMTANVLSQPRRITERADNNSDSSGYARVQFDMELNWTVKVPA